MITKERVEFLQEKTEKIFSNESFNNYRNAKIILAEMPDIEDHREAVNKSIGLIKTDGVSDRIVACYHGALLTKEQEQHLFRKYNFLKFQMRKLIEGPYVSQRWKRYEKADAIYKEVIEVQNVIVVCNLRLVPHQCEKYSLFLHEILIEDGYHSILKCIPHFDWTLDNRFSTYAVWAIINNFKKITNSHFKYRKRNKSLVVNDETEALAVAELPWDEIYHREDTQIVTSCVNLLKDQREKSIIKTLYGLDGHQIQTQPELAKQFNVSIKYIQEIRRRAIAKIRDHLGIEPYISVRQMKKARRVA